MSTVDIDTRVAAAYRQCETITRTQARNFSYGIRLLPAPKRKALSAVYAFARRIDDIGDGTQPRADKLAELDAARTDLAALSTTATDPVLVALAHAADVLPIPVAAFEELIEGCEADVRGRTYRTFDELVHYCRCVAGSIGRLSLGVFGSTDQEAAEPLADALGVALQLTNILRDVLEDRRNGRIYLPADDRETFAVALDLDEHSMLADGDEELAKLVRYQAERAESWYAHGLRLLPMLDRRSRACAAAMAGIYQRLLREIVADPSRAMRRRMSLSGWEKAAVAVRSLAGMRQ